MPERPPETPVRIIGSRELHQNLPAILRELERPDVRYVLTVHGKPRAVLIGAEPFLRLLDDPRGNASDAVVGLQLTALLGGRLDEATVEILERALDGGGNGRDG
jgi:prevent-host-death family protein